MSDLKEYVAGQNLEIKLREILTTSGTYAAIALTLVLLFSVTRRTDFGKAWYAPKQFVRKHQVPELLKSDTLFGWVFELWQMKEEKILQYGGYDVVMYLRVLSMCFWILVYFAPYGFFVLVPINVIATQNADEADSSSSFDPKRNGFIETTLYPSNYRHLSGVYFLPHLIGVIYLQAIILVLTFNTHLGYIDLRLSFRRYNPYEKNTVMVLDIPKDMRTERKIEEYFNLCYDGAVRTAHTQLP